MKNIIQGFALFLLIQLFAIPALSQSKPKPSDFGIQSKKAMRFYLEGLQQAQWRNRLEAIDFFEKAIELEPNFAHAHYQLGVNAYVKKKYEDALEHLEKVAEIKAEEFKVLDFFMGEAYFFNAQYEKAANSLSSFLEKGVGRKNDVKKAKKTLRHASFAAEAIKTPVKFKAINMGDSINSSRDEYLPFLTADDEYILFTSKRPQSVGGFNRSLQDYSEEFFYSKKVNGKWEKARNLGTPINTVENEGDASVTQDGKMIFFTACNLPDGLGSCDIYFSRREGRRWSRPVNLGSAVNSEGWDSQPCLSHDGKTLYFASGRQGGKGGRDIWYSNLVDGEWTIAKNLEAPVNTAGNEDSPFIHADDKTLYFSSDYHPGFGSQDLFVSYRGENKVWSLPKNMGYPLNTVSDESNIFVSASGKRGYINSDREGGLGMSDLYEFEMPEELRPKLATYLRGLVVDSLTEKPLYARIQLIDIASGDTVREVFTDKVDGKFLMSLPLDREYAAYVESQGYLFTSKSFNLEALSESPYFDLLIEMKKLRKDISIVLPNIFFDTGKWELKESSEVELQFLLKFLRKNPRIAVEIQGHTDDVGSETDNLNLSQKRAEAVELYLLEKGINPDRLLAKGYGESQPVAGNITDEDRAQNRRTEIKITEVRK
ncbi:MAG: OmpA family protein [Bacteroidota bacterium]